MGCLPVCIRAAQPILLNHVSRAQPLPLPAQDMTSLSHLSQPAVLHNLSQRYADHQIYTSVGSILVAVNPFESIPGLFTQSVEDLYVKQAREAEIAGN